MLRMSRTKVVGYVRVSSASQVENTSLDVQKTRIRAYCEALDLDLICIVEDAGISAKSLHRAGLQRVLAMLDAGEVEGVVITKLDRLTRSVRDLGALVETYFSGRCSLLSVGDSIDTRTSSGRLVLNVLASVAQWERERILERTAEGRQEAKRRGVRFGQKPLSQDDGGRAAVERIIALRATGATLEQIAETLTIEGHRTKRGGRWYPTTVRNYLQATTA